MFCRVRAVDQAWRPFCSERCKLQDLARWADGGYRIAAEPAGDAQNGESEKEEERSEKV